MKAGQSVSRKAGLSARLESEEGKQRGDQTIRGEVLRIQHENYFLKQYDGKEVRLHTDETTQLTGILGPGNHIGAKVTEMNDQRHALAIRSAP